MHKKILRLLALALVLALTLSILPATKTSAAQTEQQRIERLAVSTYKTALRRAGMSSFHGWCGASVDYQLRVLGIISNIVGANGNGQFDLYKNQEFTSGGYRVRGVYSAKVYDLRQSLNEITHNGTKDAYNILVGFQRTNTAAGRLYGHACFIYGLIDGRVYFTESFATTFSGRYYPEGAVISGTIDEFVRYYSAWTSFDGVIHFGLKSYADSCEYFPAYLNATVSTETQMYSQPCTPETDELSKPQRVLQVGERITVTGLYLDPMGTYWYQVEDIHTGYIPAADAAMTDMRYDDISVSGISAPTQLRKGNIFGIRGKISSTYNTIYTIRAQVYTTGEDGTQYKMTTSAAINAKSFSLYNTTVCNRMTFRLLPLGDFRYELAAVVANYYYADGALQVEWETVKLWTSDFQVVSQSSKTVSVKYDACGGEAQVNAQQLFQGQTLENLPTARRDGYEFAGWYTAAEGGEKVEADTVIDANTTLYAHWVESAQASGWFEENGKAYYVLDGVRVQGFFQVLDVTYYQGADGYLHTGWMELNGVRYYFSANGSMARGWREIDGNHYYFSDDGSVTVGWAQIDGKSYFFTDEGILRPEMKPSNSVLQQSGLATAWLNLIH